MRNTTICFLGKEFLTFFLFYLPTLLMSNINNNQKAWRTAMLFFRFLYEFCHQNNGQLWWRIVVCTSKWNPLLLKRPLFIIKLDVSNPLHYLQLLSIFLYLSQALFGMMCTFLFVFLQMPGHLSQEAQHVKM
jgi:hypothetical protein